MKALVLCVAGGVSIGIILACMYVGAFNKEADLRNLATAQKGVIEASFDTMWKIISTQAQVPEQAKEAFKEMYTPLIEGRYSQGDGTLMKWIKEQNPSFDWSLYGKLMTSIEAQRTTFFEEQKKMLSIIKQHTDLLTQMPSKWFLSGINPIEYTIISSTVTKAVMESGIEDNVDLFKKTK